MTLTLKELDTQWQRERSGEAANVVDALLAPLPDLTQAQAIERLRQVYGWIAALGVNVI